MLSLLLSWLRLLLFLPLLPLNNRNRNTVEFLSGSVKLRLNEICNITLETEFKQRLYKACQVTLCLYVDDTWESILLGHG